MYIKIILFFCFIFIFSLKSIESTKQNQDQETIKSILIQEVNLHNEARVIELINLLYGNANENEIANIINQNGLLHFAIDQESLLLIKLLLKYGADMELESYGQTALIYAVHKAKESFYGNLDIIETLLIHGAKIDVSVGSIPKNSLAHSLMYNIANLNPQAKEIRKSIIKLLLKYGLDVNSVSVFGYTLLHEAVNSKSLDIAQILIDFGADINVKVNSRFLIHDGYTPLRFALKHKDYEIIKLLIYSGVDLSITDNDKLSFFDFAKYDSKLTQIIEEVKEYKLQLSTMASFIFPSAVTNSVLIPYLYRIIKDI